MAIGDLPAVVEATDKGNYHLAPERFKNASELNEVVTSIVSADRPRSALRAQVDGQANGNDVYSLAALKAKNQGWRARSNRGGMEGALQVMGERLLRSEHRS